MKKITAGLLAAVCILALVSCSAVKPTDSRVVLTLDGEKLYYDCFRYVVLNSRADLDLGDENYWKDNPDAAETLRENVTEVLRRNRAIGELCKEYGIKLTSAEKKEISEFIKNAKAAYETGGMTFEEAIAKSYMTEYSLNYVQHITALWQKLYDYMTSEANGIIKAGDDAVRKDIPVNFRRIRYVMISCDGNDDRGEKLALAETVRNKALSGVDFVSLVKEYGEDQTMALSPDDGYYYTVGGIVRKVEDEAEKLDENGGISGVIDMQNAFFVIQRLPLDDDYVEKHFETFRKNYAARLFNEILDKKAASVVIKITDEEAYKELLG